MNVHKHMEVIFIVALATVGLGSFALDSMPEAGASASVPVIRAVATPADRVVVVCTPKAPSRA
jgi:hypothetical protein